MDHLPPPPSSMSEVQFAAIAEMAMGRRGRVRAYLFEVATALGMPLLGVTYLADPGRFAARSVIGRRVYPFDVLWNAGFIVGGLLILIGLLWPQLRLRVVGLIVLGTALSLQVVAAFVVEPGARDAFYGLFAVACWMRAVLLMKLFHRYQGVSGIGAAGAAPG